MHPSATSRPLWNITGLAAPDDTIQLSPSAPSDTQAFNLAGRINARGPLGPGNNGAIPSITVNTSTCESLDEVPWAINFLQPSRRDVLVTSDPAFWLTFDNSTVHFLFQGFARMHELTAREVEDDDGETVSVRNNMIAWAEVEFLGHVDPERSDVLVMDGENEEGHRTPTWIPVVGWGNGTGTIDGKPAGSGAGTVSARGATAAVVAVVAGVMGLMALM